MKHGREAVSYLLKHDAGLERIAREQLDRALAGLEDPKLDRHEAIHEARKCGKRLRALLRLARAGLGDEVYRRENAAIRDAARDLSGLRDAEALLETYERLQACFADEVDWRKLAGVGRALVARRKELAEDGALPRRIAAFGEQLRAVRKRLPSWPLADLGFDDLAPGLKRSYRRGRDAMRAIDHAPSDEAFHEWRKRAKEHRYHLELLRDLWPAQVKARRAEVRTLGDLLGDDHDLSVLRATLGAESERFGAGAGLLCALAARQQAELRARMWPLGLRVFAERPKALVQRYRQYWQAWQSEAERGALASAA
jgi:CHAD domain-containing protein